MRAPRCLAGVWLGGLLAVAGTGCAIGQHLPPGTAGGTFLDAPEEPVALSRGLRAHQARLDRAARGEIGAHFEVLRELLRSSAALREQIQRTQERLAVSYGERGEVSTVDREILLESARWFLELDLVLYSLWTSYRRYLPYGSEPDPYAPERAATLYSDETRLAGGLVALTAEVLRMDNARVVLELLEGELALVQFLNRGDETRGIPPESFDRLVGSYRDPERRALLQKQLQAVFAAHKQLRPRAQDDGQVAFLLSLLEESQVARELRDERAVERQWRFYDAITQRSLAAILTPIVDLYIASVVQDVPLDTVSLPRLSADPSATDRVLDALAPLDVVLVRDVRRDPGAEGPTHAVLYLGDYRAQRALGADSHPAFAVHGSAFRRGRVFLEATQHGPRVIDLDELLVAQDLAIVRYPSGDDAAVRLRRALDVLVERAFVNPPPLGLGEHAARLLGHVLGASLGVEPAPGRAFSSLRRVVERALEEDFPGEIVLSSQGGELLPAARARAGARALLLGSAEEAPEQAPQPRFPDEAL